MNWKRGKIAQNFSEKSTIYLKEWRFSLTRNSGDLAPAFSTAEQCAYDAVLGYLRLRNAFVAWLTRVPANKTAHYEEINIQLSITAIIVR